MKDRNGKELQVEQVVIVHERGPFYGLEGEVKDIFKDELDGPNKGITWAFVDIYDENSDMTETYPDWDIVMPRVFHNQGRYRTLEIIGSVRDE